MKEEMPSRLDETPSRIDVGLAVAALASLWIAAFLLLR